MPEPARMTLLRHLESNTMQADTVATVLVLSSQDATLRWALKQVDKGHEFPLNTALKISSIECVHKIVKQLWNVDAVFEDDENFSLTRLVLLTSRYPQMRISTDQWQRMKAQIRRLWRSGQLPPAVRLMHLLWYARSIKDDTFAIELLAHSDLDLETTVKLARVEGKAATRYVEVRWRRVEAKRIALFQKVWLKAYVSNPEHGKLSWVATPLLLDLYESLIQDGYAGYWRQQHTAVDAP